MNPHSIEFGTITPSQTLDRDLTISNPSASVGILNGSATIGGDGFSVVSGDGTFSLAPGKAHVVSIRFTPSDGRRYSGALFISHNATNGSSPLPVQLSGVGTGLDRGSVIAALEYWRAAVGITYELTAQKTEPRLLIRTGMDGLAPQGGGRGLIDGTFPEDNRARSGLVVFEPLGGQYCAPSPASDGCRYLYRHEIGHALGFLDHSNSGLMRGGPEFLTDRERGMMVALYSLPHGAIVEPNGRWSIPSSNLSGVLTDIQAAQDIIDWNMIAEGGAAFRQQGIITRWELPVRVYLAQ